MFDAQKSMNFRFRWRKKKIKIKKKKNQKQIKEIIIIIGNWANGEEYEKCLHTFR